MLFRGPLVRAIIEGHKVQTRRPVDHTNCIVNGDKRWPSKRFARFPLDKAWVDPGPSPAGNPGPYLKCDSTHSDDDGAMARLYPPWSIGDRIWVRETWCLAWDDERNRWPEVDRYLYRADGQDVGNVDDMSKSPWQPSIHMPRAASRLTLEVTRIRAERVQSITEDDARAEGFTLNDAIRDKVPSARDVFALTWGDIYGPGSWERNGWVWALDFRVVTP